MIRHTLLGPDRETHLQDHKVERNPKHESRMPKQIRMTQTQMTKCGFIPGSVVAAIALFSLLTSGVALPLTVGLEADFVSRYVWRGLALSDGPVLQPSAWVSFAGFTLTPWANVAFRDGSARAGLNELDLTLDYSRDVFDLTVNPSLAVYSYPNQADAAPTGELALALSYPVGPVSVFSNHSLDLMATPGAYFGDAGLSFESEVAQSLTVEASAYAGWASARFNDANFEVNQAALNVGGIDLALCWSPAGLFYLRPHAGLSVILDRELRDAVTSPLLIAGGLAIGRDF